MGVGKFRRICSRLEELHTIARQAVSIAVRLGGVCACTRYHATELMWLRMAMLRPLWERGMPRAIHRLYIVMISLVTFSSHI